MGNHLTGEFMFYDPGCRGRVVLGGLPEEVQQRLEALPGEWLEFDRPTGAIVVRHIQPTAAPMLPTIAAELVRMLAETPPCLQAGVPGGSLFVHTEEGGRLVRLHVEQGGTLHIEWAHPDYERASKRPYAGGRETPIEPVVQRLNGTVTLTATYADRAAEDIQKLADTYEGLYPEGDFAVTADTKAGSVQVNMHDVNLDVELLVTRLQKLAQPGTLTGSIEVGTFGEDIPEGQIRFLFEDGGAFVQHPLLWPDDN